MRTIDSVAQLALALMLTFAVGGAQASLVRLYNTGLGNLPQEQDWLHFGASNGVTTAVEPNGTAVSSGGATNGYAGFATHSFDSGAGGATVHNPALPRLNANRSIALMVELQVQYEAHQATDQAGLSLLMFDGTGRGIALNFWADQIWSQAADHSGAEEQAFFDTTADIVRYEIAVWDTHYGIWADGEQLFRGDTRVYDAYPTRPSLYETPNLLFIGDAAQQASSEYLLGDMILSPGLYLTTPPPPTDSVPITATAWLLLPGLMLLRRRIAGR